MICSGFRSQNGMSTVEAGRVLKYTNLNFPGVNYLKIAISCGNIEAVKILLESQKLDRTECFHGALSAAVEHGNVEILKLLLAEHWAGSEKDIYRAVQLAQSNNEIRDMLKNDHRVVKSLGRLSKMI